MDAFIWIVIIGTSIWVLIDAKTIGVKKGQIEGMGNMGPVAWFFVCLLFWIVGFPFYLAKRGEFKRVNSVQQEPTGMNDDSITQIERLASMKEKGILTDDEFNQKKQELLNQQAKLLENN